MAVIALGKVHKAGNSEVIDSFPIDGTTVVPCGALAYIHTDGTIRAATTQVPAGIAGQLNADKKHQALIRSALECGARIAPAIVVAIGEPVYQTAVTGELTNVAAGNTLLNATFESLIGTGYDIATCAEVAVATNLAAKISFVGGL